MKQWISLADNVCLYLCSKGLALKMCHVLGSQVVQMAEENVIGRNDRGRTSSVGGALDCRAGGRGFDFRGRTDTQGLEITEK